MMRYRVARSIHAFKEAEWDGLAGDQLMLTHRWQRVVEASRRDYQPRYLLVEDAHGPLAALVINLADSFGRSGWRERLMRRMTTMVRAPLSTDYGIALRPGLTPTEVLPQLLRGLGRISWREQRLLLAVNDVPAADVPAWRRAGFLANDSQPAHMLLHLHGATYDAYLERLAPKDRSELRRMRRRAETLGVRFEHGPLQEDAQLYPMLCEVFARYGKTDQQMPLTPEFFPALVREMPHDVIVFKAFVGDQLVGYLLCLVRGELLWWPSAGLHYELARPSYAYFLLIDEMVQWAIAHGYRCIYGGMSNEREKQRHGFQPHQRWLCLRATVSPANRLIIGALPVLRRLLGKSDMAAQVGAKGGL